MSLSKAVDTNKAPIPYEVFLCVMDAFIQDVKAAQISELLCLHYNIESSSRLAVCHEIPDGAEHLARYRFKALRIPLHVNRKTRAMVDRIFPTVPMGKVYNVTYNLLRVLPDVDFFIPFYTSGINALLQVQGSPSPYERFFHQVVHLPNAEAFSVLQNVQSVLLHGEIFFKSCNQAGIDALARYPSIKRISICLITVSSEVLGPNATIHAGIWPIDGTIFPDLALWEATTPNINALCRPFYKKGIKFYGVLQYFEKEYTNTDFIEFLFTKDGVRMQFLQPNCECCKAGVPFGGRTKE